ncbi:sulfatase [Zhouia amylolytica]|uniref:sulfatase family protein n=1 Tax=Zhouia amylolytica TaxID=376730 RepID=UPI0020CDB079|nr:sulfatase [Zhouia amylolytica]MCQ0111832.1 sulfatase [Zhouia amylolytica]
MRTKLSYFLFFLALIAMSFPSCSTQTKEAKTSSRPNIVFIMTDDHSYQTLSAYDDRYIQTPNLDRIANEGVIFKNSFVSNSICAPSRAVMLTGKHSHINGQIDNFTTFDNTQPNFAKYLQQAGYQTSLIGKWHLRSDPTGFDNWEILIGQGNYYNSTFIENGEKTPSKGYVTDVITDKAMQWLDGRKKDQPFCLLVHHKAAHRIWQPNITMLDSLSEKEYKVPANFFDNYEGRKAAKLNKMSIIKDMDLVYDLKMNDDALPSKYRNAYKNMYNLMNPEQKEIWDAYYTPILEQFKEAGLTDDELAIWKYQRYMNDYLKVIRSLDDNVGRLLDYLDQNNLKENTLVVYTSDQGFYMGEHGWFDKRYMYEQSLRTPLLMRYPEGIKNKGAIEELVQNIDYAPTFLDFAGVDIPEDMQGASLKPLLNNEKMNWREAIYYHYYESPNEHGVKKHYGIRTDRYKLIHFYEDMDEWEFYDLQKDPEEMHNLFHDEQYSSLIKELKSKLEELQKQYKVTTY